VDLRGGRAEAWVEKKAGNRSGEWKSSFTAERKDPLAHLDTAMQALMKRKI